MDNDVSLTTVALVAGGLAPAAVVFGTVDAGRLRAQGRRVPAAITSTVAFGWILMVAITVLLVTRALGNE